MNTVATVFSYLLEIVINNYLNITNLKSNVNSQ